MGKLSTIIGTGIAVAAHARCDHTEKDIYQQGYNAGHHDGRRLARPVVVDLGTRRPPSEGDCGFAS